MAAVPTKENLYRMSDLSRETGVSTATIKFYIREGLLPAPTLKTGRNMAYYDRTFVDRIRVIKELQQKRFLPLDVIKAILDKNSDVISQGEIDTLLSIEGTFYEQIHYAPDREPMTRKQILDTYGGDPRELQFAVELGVLTPAIRDGVEYFEGDDILLIEAFRKAEDAGFNSDFMPHELTLPVYVDAMNKLAKEELRMFTKAATGKVDDARVAEMALAGVKLVESFLVLLRRKCLLKALQELRLESENESTGTGE